MKAMLLTATAEHAVAVSPETPGRAAMPREAQLARPMRWLLRLMHAVVVRCRTARQRRQLAQLSDRQLRDAGIDPALAGRGKAIAVDMAAHLRLQSLGFG